jgi:hypothetical protein
VCHHFFSSRWVCCPLPTRGWHPSPRSEEPRWVAQRGSLLERRPMTPPGRALPDHWTLLLRGGEALAPVFFCSFCSFAHARTHTHTHIHTHTHTHTHTQLRHDMLVCIPPTLAASHSLHVQPTANATLLSLRCAGCWRCCRVIGGMTPYSILGKFLGYRGHLGPLLPPLPFLPSILSRTRFPPTIFPSIHLVLSVALCLSV